jgi:hypothetical protein
VRDIETSTVTRRVGVLSHTERERERERENSNTSCCSVWNYSFLESSYLHDKPVLWISKYQFEFCGVYNTILLMKELTGK